VIAQQPPALRRRAAEHASEDRGEVTVAREPNLECQRGEIVGFWQLRQRTRQAEPRQVLMQRDAFDAPEQLGEVHGGRVHRSPYIVQPDRIRQLGRQELFGAPNQLRRLRTDHTIWPRASTEDTTEQRQHQLLGFEAVGQRRARRPVQQARAQELDARAGRAPARERWQVPICVALTGEVHAWSDRQRGDTPADGPADPIAFTGSEEHDLIGVADHLVGSDVTYEESAVGQVDRFARADALGLGVPMIGRLVYVGHTGARQLNRSEICLDCV
jgi:hypothetical protein